MPLEIHLLHERGFQPRNEVVKLCPVIETLHSRKLIAAKPGDEFLVTQDPVQPRGQCAQHEIACDMAHLVIDFFEFIQVDANHRNLGRQPFGDRQLM